MLKKPLFRCSVFQSTNAAEKMHIFYGFKFHFRCSVTTLNAIFVCRLLSYYVSNRTVDDFICNASICRTTASVNSVSHFIVYKKIKCKQSTKTKYSKQMQTMIVFIVWIDVNDIDIFTRKMFILFKYKISSHKFFPRNQRIEDSYFHCLYLFNTEK